MTFGGVVIVPDPVTTSRIEPAAFPTGPNAAWQEAAGLKEVSAPLPSLPAGMILAELPEPLHYDAGRRLLLYRGLMSNGSYLFLRRLSPEPPYLDALEQLYLASAADEPASRGGFLAGTLIAAATAAASLGAWLILR